MRPCTPVTTLLTAGLLALATAPLGAQEQVYLLGYEATNGDDFGHAVAGAGDVDADGVPDVIVGSPFDDPNGAQSGSVTVYSGKNGLVIWSRGGEGPGDNFGWAVDGIGDIDGDGHGEVIVGARGYDGAGNPFGGAAYVISGATSFTMVRFTFAVDNAQLGHAVAGIGDVDGDGVPDFMFSIPWRDAPGGLTDAGYYGAYSGADYSLIFSGTGNQVGALCGYSLDLLRSGSPASTRVLVGEPGHDGAGIDRGAVRIVSGLGGITSFWHGSTDGEWFGASVAGVGDVDGDGWADIAYGAPYADILGVGTDAGTVRVRSGLTGTFLFDVPGASAGAKMGWSVAGIGDFDGDGLADVLAGAPGDGSVSVGGGEARIVSGSTGWTLHSWTGGVNDSCGSAVAGLGDLNGDGLADVVIGAKDAPFGAGEAYVRLGGAAAPSVYCTAKVNSQGCTPRIGAKGVASLSIADGFVVTAADVLNQKFGILFWGSAPNAAPFLGGTLCVQSPVRRTPVQDSGGNFGPDDCTGSYSFAFSHAYMASAGLSAGDRVHAQYWSRDPAAPFTVGLTDAAAFDIVP